MEPNYQGADDVTPEMESSPAKLWSALKSKLGAALRQYSPFGRSNDGQSSQSTHTDANQSAPTPIARSLSEKGVSSEGRHGRTQQEVNNSTVSPPYVQLNTRTHWPTYDEPLPSIFLNANVSVMPVNGAESGHASNGEKNVNKSGNSPFTFSANIVKSPTFDGFTSSTSSRLTPFKHISPRSTKARLFQTPPRKDRSRRHVSFSLQQQVRNDHGSDANRYRVISGAAKIPIKPKHSQSDTTLATTSDPPISIANMAFRGPRPKPATLEPIALRAPDETTGTKRISQSSTNLGRLDTHSKFAGGTSLSAADTEPTRRDNIASVPNGQSGVVVTESITSDQLVKRMESLSNLLLVGVVAFRVREALPIRGVAMTKILATTFGEDLVSEFQESWSTLLKSCNSPIYRENIDAHIESHYSTEPRACTHADLKGSCVAYDLMRQGKNELEQTIRTTRTLFFENFTKRKSRINAGNSRHDSDGTSAGESCSARGCISRGKSICNRCQSTYYCSKKCQIAHWKFEHRHKCETKGGSPNVKLEESSDRQSEKQLCAAIGCAMRGKLLCIRCRARSYCSKQCQTVDWKLEHRKQCIPKDDVTTASTRCHTHENTATPRSFDQEFSTTIPNNEIKKAGTVNAPGIDNTADALNKAWESKVGKPLQVSLCSERETKGTIESWLKEIGSKNTFPNRAKNTERAKQKANEIIENWLKESGSEDTIPNCAKDYAKELVESWLIETGLDKCGNDTSGSENSNEFRKPSQNSATAPKHGSGADIDSPTNQIDGILKQSKVRQPWLDNEGGKPSHGCETNSKLVAEKDTQGTKRKKTSRAASGHDKPSKHRVTSSKFVGSGKSKVEQRGKTMNKGTLYTCEHFACAHSEVTANEFRKCGLCEARYCSAKCSQIDWRRHKNVSHSDLKRKTKTKTKKKQNISQKLHDCTNADCDKKEIRVKDFQRCGLCSARYCSKKCVDFDWKHHKKTHKATAIERIE